MSDPATLAQGAHRVGAGATDWRSVWLLYGAGVIAAFQIGKIPPAIPMLQADLGLSLVTATWGLSLLSVLGLVLGLQAGGLVDRFGNRRAMLWGLAVAAAAAAATALSAGATGFLAARLFEGLGHLMIVVAGPVLVVRVTAPADRPLALALWASFLTVGIALMNLAAPALIAVGGLAGLFWANAGLLALATLAVATVLPNRIEPTVAAPVPAGGRWMAALVSGPLAIYRHPRPVLLAYVFAAYCIAAFAFLGLVPTFLSERIGLDLVSASSVASAVALAALAGIFGAGMLMRRGVGFTAIGLGAFAAMGLIGPPLYWLDLPVPVVVAGCIAFQACAGLIPGAVFAAVPENAPSADRIGLANGLLAQTGNLGNLVGPPLMAWIITVGGWAFAPIHLIGGSLVGIALVLMLDRARP